MTPEEAHRIGLVDALAPQANVLQAATEALAQYTAVPSGARGLTKVQFRAPVINRLLEKREQDTKNFVKLITAPATQAMLQAAAQRLAKK